MEDESVVIATTTAIQVIGVDLLTPLLSFIFGADGLFAGFTLDQVFSVLGTLWTIFVILS